MVTYGDKFYYIFIYIVAFINVYLKLNVSTMDFKWENVCIYRERKSLINMEILNHKSTFVKTETKHHTFVR